MGSHWRIISLLLLIVGGCGATATPELRAELPSSAGGLAGVYEEEPAPLPGACRVPRVYFGFDSAELDHVNRLALIRAADCLSTRGSPTVHLLGATDPRGTEEYNLALGDRRARAVRRYLVAMGVQAESLSFMSVGEELAAGEDETSWARDRHVAAEDHDPRGTSLAAPLALNPY